MVLYLTVPAGEEDAEGASHHLRAVILSLIHTAGMRGREVGHQVLLGYISKLLSKQKKGRKKRERGQKQRE
jgi:hypothetical protein